MADISKITLPSNVTYDVKDTTARSGLANKQDKITAITAQTTQAVYPIKIDSQGHITAYGSAVTIPAAVSTTQKVYTGSCDTLHTALEKVVTLHDATGFNLTAGVVIIIYFEHMSGTFSGTSAISLNVNNTGSKTVYRGEVEVKNSYSDLGGWNDKSIVGFAYDGSHWNRFYSMDNNTTYLAMTESDAKSGTVVNAMVISPSVLATAIDYRLPTKTSQLTNDSGYITNSSAIYESRLNWGNSNIAGNVSPVDAGCIDEFGHNKLAFLPAECINAAYSVDGGATWIDYGLSNEQKVSLVTNGSVGVTIGKNETKTASNIAQHKSRIRIAAQNTSGVQRIYTASKKWLINVSTNGASGTTITMRYRTIANAMSGTETWVNVGTYTVSGWSGWNSIPWINNFGGSTTSQTGQPGEVEFVLSATGLSSSNGTACMSDIRLIGATNWKPASELAKNGHVYSFDVNQNVTFPAIVNASSFNGYTIASNVPSGAKFTDTTYGANRGISNVSGNFGHSNTAITAQNTQAVYPIKIDAYGHITSYGSAVTIPAAVTESTVSGWGFTKNTGTVTGIKMNGASKGTSGVVDLGTVITSHQDISGKVDKINITAQNTQAVYPIKINAQGQITGYGSAVTIPTVPSAMSQSEATTGTSTTARTITAKVLSDTITDKIGAEVAFDELWTNGTEANFASQLVNIDLRQYDFVLIMFSYGTELNGVSSVLCKPNGTTYRLINGGSRKDYRDATVTTSGVEFGSGIKVGAYGDTNGNSNNNSLIIPRAIYGIKKFIVKQQNYSLPELVTKGDVTNPTISPSGSISSAHFHYALSADKKFGVLNGNMIVKGVGGTSTREYVHTGVYVEPKPSEQKIIYGTVSGYVNYTSLSHANYITVETTGELCVSFKASTNSTSFNVNTGFVRWEDFYS